MKRKVYRISILLTGLCLVGSLAQAQVVENCPLEANEVNPCDNETAEVQAALIGKSILKSFSYCLRQTPEKPYGGLQCRGPVIYKDANGNPDLSIFEDRFIYSEVTRFGASRIFAVQQPNGNYNFYQDNITDGIVRVDYHNPLDTDVVVSFDSEYRPTFTVRFTNAGSDPVEVTEATLTHKAHAAEFSGGLDKAYTVVNPPQAGQ